jgi:hypothetical protein
MKTNSMTSLFRLLFLFPACFIAFQASAQSYWVLSYQGTETVGDTNKLTTVKVTDKTLIERCAAGSGASTDDLALVLHFDANSVGDTLEVINVNDPNLFRCELFKFAFAQTYTNSAGTVMKRIAYVYDETSGHSRGTVVIHQRLGDANGKKNKKSGPLEGTIHYWLGIWDENVADPNPTVASGKFKAVRSLTFD